MRTALERAALKTKRTYPRWLVYGLGLFAVVMIVFSAVLSREHHAAEAQRNQAISRFVALESRDLHNRDPSLAMQLALVAYRLWGTPPARAALIDTGAGEMPTRLLGPKGETLIALGDDGHRLVVAYPATGQLKLYAVSEMNLAGPGLTLAATLPVAPATEKLDSVAFAHDGRLLAVGYGNGQVRLWSLAAPSRPAELATLRAGSGAVRGLGFSPAGGALAAADADGSVQRWSLADPHDPSPAPLLVAPGRPALDAVSYSHGGSTLAAAGAGGTLIIWHAHAGVTPLTAVSVGSPTLTANPTLTAVAYSPDGHTLAAGGDDGVIRLWTLSRHGATTAERPSLTGSGAVTSLSFGRDGRYLAAGSSADAAEIWATANWHETATLPHPAGVTGVAFTRGDASLISADAAATTRIWQFPPPSARAARSAVTTLTYSPDKPLLTIGGGHGAEQWDVADEWRPAPSGAWDAPALAAVPDSPYSTITSTTTTPAATTPGDATMTATTPTGATVTVNPHAGDEALRRTRAQTTVVDSALSPDGQLFAAASTDHRVWLWDVRTPSAPKLVGQLAGFSRWAYAVVFSPNSQTLFAGSADHTVRIWNVTDPDHPRELINSLLTGPRSTIVHLAISPDGVTLAAATADGSVWLWSVGNPNASFPLGTLTAAGRAPQALTFSPTGDVLVAGSNRRLTFWHYHGEEVADRVCALEGTPITRSEWQQYVPGAPYNPPCANWTPPVTAAPGS